MYYDANEGDFVVLDYDDELCEGLVGTPYRESFRRSVWNEFWSSLSEEDYVLADSYDEKHGFFDYMRETGLMAYYDKAYEVVAENAINQWERENNLSIDWNNVSIN